MPFQSLGGVPIGYSAKLPFVASHNYGAAHADWTLSASENMCDIIYATNANLAANAIATPTLNKVFLVANASGYNLTVKASGQTGVTVSNGVSTWIRGNGTDFVAAGISAASASSTSAAGIVELATNAETLTGTDTERAITPDDLAYRLLSPVTNGLSKRVTSALAKTTDTALAAVTGLSTALAAGATYIFDICLPVTATANGGVKVDLNTSDTLTATSINYVVEILTATASAVSNATALAASAGSTSAAVVARIRGVIVVNAAGTLIVRGAQNASHADTTTFLANGFMSLTRIA